MKFSLASFRCRLGPTVFTMVTQFSQGFSKHEQMKFSWCLLVRMHPFLPWLRTFSPESFKMLQHCGVTLSEQLHCVDLCHSTQTMNSSRVYDCHLPVRATMATHTWAKLTPKSWAESLECSLYMPLTWSDLSHRCISSVSCLLRNVIVHSWELTINTLSCVLHFESSLLLGFFHANAALWQ